MAAGGINVKNITLLRSHCVPLDPTRADPKTPMNKHSDRPPILFFVLAFIGLVAAALCLAALSPAPEQAGDGSSAFDQRNTAPDTKGSDR